MRFDTVKRVLMKICVFRDVIPCGPVYVGTVQRFGVVALSFESPRTQTV